MTTRSRAGTYKPRIPLSLVSSHCANTEPENYAQASQNSNWIAAMREEYTALLKQNTWSLATPPTGSSVIGCKWVFRLKLNPDGTVNRHKARLVAKDFHQTPRLDYFETFSPVIKQPTI